MKQNDKTTDLSRRQLLKGGAALAGAAAGTAITGFPAVHRRRADHAALPVAPR